MKVRQLSTFTRDAIARTIVHVEDRNRTAPTFDGRVLHIARIKREDHVLHEVAHWICSKAEHRELENYGLGTDPDGGPETTIFQITDLRAGRVSADVAEWLREVSGNEPEKFRALIQASLSYQEELASVVSLILMRRSGLPWAKEMRRVFGKATDERFWGFVVELTSRGVDLADPLSPFPLRTVAA